MQRLRSHSLASLGLLVPGLWLAGAAKSAEVSAWDRGQYSAIRLVSGAARDASGAPVLRAGVEIKLDPRWKTYWRYPGDSGVPPKFDFASSVNVQSATVLWPAPMRFEDGGGFSIGYSDGVVFPVHVRPVDPARPVTLRLQIEYAVCKSLCVPEQAKAQLELRANSAESVSLSSAEARVPEQVTLGAGGPLSIRSVRLEPGEPRSRVVVEVKSDAPDDLDLFAEGPTAEWSLPLPGRADDPEPGVRRFAFDLDGLPGAASHHGATLRLTAVTRTKAIEVLAPLP